MSCIHNCFQVTSDFHMPRATYIFQASAVSRNWETGFWDGSHRPARLGLGFAAEFRQGIPTSFAFFAASLSAAFLPFWSTSFSPPVAPSGPQWAQEVFNYFYRTFEEHFKDDPLWKDPVKWLCSEEHRWFPSFGRCYKGIRKREYTMIVLYIYIHMYVCIYIWYVYIYIHMIIDG